MTQDTNTTSGAADLRAEVAMIDAAMVEMTNITPPLKRSECARLLRAALAAGQATAAQQGVAYAALPDADRDYMRKVVAVAVTMLFDDYKEDVMRVFSTGELSEFVTITAAMGGEQVEDIYRRAWDLLSLPVRPSHGQAPAAQQAGEQPLPLLVRDIAADFATTPIQVCMALSALGFGGHSVNMVITPTMAQALRAHFSATAQAAPAHKDSTPELHVGDSAFESWYSSYNPTHKGDKQRARDAYAAGMGDPLVMAAPAAVAGPSDVVSIQRQAFIRGWDKRGMAHQLKGTVETDERMRALMDIYFPRTAAPTTQPAPQQEAQEHVEIPAKCPYFGPSPHRDVWLEGWYAACATQPAPPQAAGKAVHQFRKQYCADWYDGRADHGDSGGPYEERTLYTVPQPAAQGDALDAAQRTNHAD